jgi:hypothetical protein
MTMYQLLTLGDVEVFMAETTEIAVALKGEAT